MTNPDSGDATVERSLTLSEDLDRAAHDAFGGRKPTDSLRMAIRQAVEDEQDDRECVERLTEMLYVEWSDNRAGE